MHVRDVKKNNMHHLLPHSIAHIILTVEAAPLILVID